MTNPALNIVLVLPGGLSFGAYEAGVCSALLEVMEESKGKIVVEHIVGSSCGAVTGLLAAAAIRHKHLRPILEEIWVERASVKRLLWPRAKFPEWWPLSTRGLEEWARDLFYTSRGESLQPAPVRLTVATAPLNGVEVLVPLGVDDAGKPVFERAWTFRDSRSFQLGYYPVHWNHALESVMASAAHPLVFAPRKIGGPLYREGLGLDEAGWVVDGGAADNLPIQLALEGLPNKSEANSKRLVIVVHEGFTPPAPIENPTYWSAGIRALYMLWKGPLLADLLRMKPLTVPMMLVSPGESGLEGMRWGNLRGFVSAKARKSDFEKGKRDFLDQWEFSCWPAKIDCAHREDSRYDDA